MDLPDHTVPGGTYLVDPLIYQYGARWPGDYHVLYAEADGTGATGVMIWFKSGEVRSGRAQREISILRQLRSCPNIIDIIDYSLYRSDNEARMYTKYYKQGSLSDCADRHKKRKRPVPRPFIWKVFLSLAEALCAMQEVPGSVGIIHHHISLSHIFLANGSKTQYPHVVLGRFRESERIRDNVAAAVVSDARNYKLTSNVKQCFAADLRDVAIVIVTLCILKRKPWEYVHRDPENPAGADEDPMLNTMLRECLRPNWEERIDCFKLREALRRRTDEMTGQEEQLIYKPWYEKYCTVM